MAHIKVSLFLVAVCCISLQNAVDLSVGSSLNNQLVYTENVKLSAIPLKTRTKNVFYNDNNARLIKGIWAVDLDRSEAKVTITSGGIGSSFANVKLRSQRGEGLNYQVQVFV